MLLSFLFFCLADLIQISKGEALVNLVVEGEGFSEEGASSGDVVDPCLRVPTHQMSLPCGGSKF